ncbi:MAG: ADP-ribosylglycohydrolase family protein [Blastocatellia bacterium]
MTEPQDAEILQHRIEKFTGSLLGGAIGDALGAAVEFKSIDAIRDIYGPRGVTDLELFAYGRRGAITDDTQMTLFTAEGLLRAATRRRLTGDGEEIKLIYQSYLRWLHTQDHRSKSPYFEPAQFDGWLITVKDLYSARAAGLTCLSALSWNEMGRIDKPLNNSKGCGGVMRVAPVGLVAKTAAEAFQLGCESAAITHSHPSGYFSSGCFAAIIFDLLHGSSLEAAIEAALHQLETPANFGHEECSRAIHKALSLWRDPTIVPSPEVLAWMGGGWVGEEALAISLYCALVAGDDFTRGLLLAVNHSGDSDSTGSITGNILGLTLGRQALPERWLAELELRDVIETVAIDLARLDSDSPEFARKYPGS